ARKRAGKVRDMDVLISHVANMEVLVDESDCQIGLLEYLSGKRLRNARKLHQIIQKNSVELRQRLKRCNAKILKLLQKTKNGAMNKQKAAVVHALAGALQISSDLAKTELLRNANLHEYRLGRSEEHTSELQSQ